jgi:hypothetical protein
MTKSCIASKDQVHTSLTCDIICLEILGQSLQSCMRLMKQYGAAPQECCHLPRIQLTKMFSHLPIQNVSQCRSAMACCGQAPANMRALKGRKALPAVGLTYLQSAMSLHMCSVDAGITQMKVCCIW